MTTAQALDFASVFVFGLTGGLAASRAQLDLVGFLFLATITAVGGGTARDVILDRQPVFWVGEPSNILVAAAAGLICFVWAPRLESRRMTLEWLDAVALAVAVGAGITAARWEGAGPTVTVIMGVMTGCLGGILRDVVCNEQPMVLRRRELYVTAAAAGAAAGAVALELGLGTALASAVCGVVAFGLRAGSMRFGWRLPEYRSRPPKR
ncbi:trimeric intracellular cation channel family protein [Albimonas sp. CAU 1670]|uniref:trimeric intracellular cation channel family protein n=1 Tax=Albimonas sp. CAU 1670 TaxID=3032599 RepID=UPI0023DB7435|nr:trimeric intracellular cation channel family protein [Albimonas sp. CAU 1670]MDF2234631.1 trimeric intracellular cation channel family protein [Albimonas sp. CAU 1670]